MRWQANTALALWHFAFVVVVTGLESTIKESTAQMWPFLETLTVGNPHFNVLAFYTALVLSLYAILGAFIWLKPLEVAKKPYLTWAIMIPLLMLPLWLGPVFWILTVLLISIYGFKEFAKGTGLYAQKAHCLTVYVVMIAMAVCAMINDYGLFMVAPIWGVVALSTIPVFQNRFENAIQNMALSVVGLVYFGWFLGHLGFLVRSEYGLGYLLFVLIFTQFNDAMCFLWGKLFGKTHFTAISPKKTIEGSVLALLSSMVIAFLNWPIAFPHFEWWLVAMAGFAVSFGGQMGDLVMSTFKRDLGVKDFGTLLPGHGGILDRVDSLVWVSPLFFHMARYFHSGFGC
ncbi:phosphatidate cytidylyltransferase [Vampirovibrio chlorellavorus]|uniref:phosphatidate cytidylyltransferase n=1 Tax=Vampirovibrio chlorellavorus TaxID=758823 RepID=UPI0026EF0BBB|nr:phosphatidate cytidylyltransferase [Vampirovibrio chlorellavorus]